MNKENKLTLKAIETQLLTMIKEKGRYFLPILNVSSDLLEKAKVITKSTIYYNDYYRGGPMLIKVIDSKDSQWSISEL